LGLDPLRIEARLALGPAGRRGGGFAERLKEHLAPRRTDKRQRGGGAERGREPGARPGAEKPLVEEAIGGEAFDPLVREVLRGDANQRAHEFFHAVERGFARHPVAQRPELAIGEVLAADRRALRIVAPRLERVAAPHRYIEAAFDEALL